MTDTAKKCKDTREYHLQFFALNPDTGEESYLERRAACSADKLPLVLQKLANRLYNEGYPASTTVVVRCEVVSSMFDAIVVKRSFLLGSDGYQAMQLAMYLPAFISQATIARALADTTAEQNRISQNTTISPEHIIKALDGG